MTIFFLFFFVLASTTPYVSARYYQYQFALQWGASVCQSEPQKCIGPETPTEFTIKFFRFSYEPLRPSPVLACNLQQSDITGQIERLTKVWPDVHYYGVANPAEMYFPLWAEEWKFGCYFFSPAQYFDKAMTIYDSLGPLKDDITSDDCRPGQFCDLDKLLKAYKVKYPDRHPSIMCTQDQSGRDQIQEFRFSMSNNWKFVDEEGLRVQQCYGPTAYWPLPITSTSPEVLPEASSI